MTLDEARAFVREAIRQALGEAVGGRAGAQDISLAELDIDSITAMEICIAVEEKTGIEIDLADLGPAPSLDIISNLLVARSRG